MIRETPKNIAIMALMVNARTHDKWFQRFKILKMQKKVRGNYLDVLLKRLLDEGMIERQKVMGHRGKRVYGYRATEKGYNWYIDPSLRSIPPASTQRHEVGLVPLEGLIERDGWVERWNNVVIHIPEWAAKRLRKTMKKSRNHHRDPAKQMTYDVPAFHATTSYSKRKGHTLRLRCRLEPFRDHLAEWFGLCGMIAEEVVVLIKEIEQQLPGSFKQQEHRVIGAFASALKTVEGRFTIKTTDLETGRTMIKTELEYSRRTDLQLSGDGAIVDSVAGALAAYQTAEVVNVARTRGELQRVENILRLILQGKRSEAMKLLNIQMMMIQMMMIQMKEM